MAQKNNTKCLRLSDELIEMIESQTGATFTQKFENLVIRCMWELPAKEAELKRVEETIQNKRNEIAKLSERTVKMINTISDLERRVQALYTAIFDHSKIWEV